MTINPKPGNQPDPSDMSDAFETNTDAENPAPPHPNLAEEELAAKLGDFA